MNRHEFPPATSPAGAAHRMLGAFRKPWHGRPRTLHHVPWTSDGIEDMADPITLPGERITLRELTDQDFKAVHSYGSDPEVVRFLRWGPSSEADTREFLAEAREQREAEPRTDFTLAIVTREGDRLIGTIGLHRNASNAMLGYALRRDVWGQGFATEAAELIVDFGFQTLKVHRIWAGVDPANAASARLLGKLGMRQEGHLREETCVRGEFRDTVLFAVLDREWGPSGIASRRDGD